MATPTTSAEATLAAVTETNTQQNGLSPSQQPAPAQDTKGKQPEKKSEQDAQPTDDKKISGAELKKRAKEEKAARRAAEKAAKDASSTIAAAPLPQQQQKSQQSTSTQQQQQQQQPQGSLAHRRLSQGAAVLQQNAIPFRAKTSPIAVKEVRKPNKEVGLFGHLYSLPKKHGLEGVSKEVHPAVLALGLQMSNYVVCGSNARCVGMLLAFKKAIQDYKTPQGTSLARHLTSHHLSPQIDYLKSHRPISVSMGNAIRWLKDQIIHIDPDTPESLAKADICASIDNFIRERITVADTVIATSACPKIRPHSTVVTFGKSSIVEKTLLLAHEQGTEFGVTVLDSRPLFEGRNLARSLASRGVKVTYMLHTGAAHALKDADLVLLGAHAMMSNGRLYSRVGTAAVAMHAHARDVPVIVCCESIKFTDRVALDSIVLNEIAPPDELVVSSPANNTSESTNKKGGNASNNNNNNKKEKNGEEEKSEGREETGLKGWRDVEGLQLLNVLYDVTPAEYINMVITEYGSLPPSSVPVVHRISSERDVRT